MDRISSFRGVYFFLSNFYRELDGTFVERDFQAAKATNDRDRQFVLSSGTPALAKSRGHQIRCRLDWDIVKIDVMLNLLRDKFQSSPLREQLLATGNTELIEGNTWGDTFWGQVDGHGQNMLGALLMAVRDDLRAEHKPGVWSMSDPNRPKDVVYCGRAMPRFNLPGSKWGNPFHIGQMYGGRKMDRKDAVNAFDRWLDNSVEGQELLKNISELHGMDLGCWCHHWDGSGVNPRHCHCDLLLSRANKLVGVPV